MHSPTSPVWLTQTRQHGIEAAVRAFRTTIPTVRQWLRRYQAQGSRDSRNSPGLPRSCLAPSSVGTDADTHTEHTGIPHGCADSTSLRGQAGQQALRALPLAPITANHDTYAEAIFLGCRNQ